LIFLNLTSEPFSDCAHPPIASAAALPQP
jgi:hypothetical protein